MFAIHDRFRGQESRPVVPVKWGHPADGYTHEPLGDIPRRDTEAVNFLFDCAFRFAACCCRRAPCYFTPGILL